MSADNFEPMRKREPVAGNEWSNSGKLKRRHKGTGNEGESKRYQARGKRVKMAKVPKRVRRLLDGD
jgi:hypothetical protein